MKNIAVLIDFTELCHTSVKTAASLAKKHESIVTLIHVADQSNEDDKQELEERFAPYLTQLKSQSVNGKIELVFGEFELMVGKIIRSGNFDLAVVGTHGIVGIKQTLFGSNILNLLEKLTIPVLVVQENSPIPKMGSEILLPMSQHNDFIRKVEFASTFSKVLDSKVVLYMIEKTDEDDVDVIANKNIGLEYLATHNIPHEFIAEEATVYSYGYGKQIIKYASDNNVGLISIMTRISIDTTILGKAEKERILLNEAFIPVLCVNG